LSFRELSLRLELSEDDVSFDEIQLCLQHLLDKSDDAPLKNGHHKNGLHKIIEIRQADLQTDEKDAHIEKNSDTDTLPPSTPEYDGEFGE